MVGVKIGQGQENQGTCKKYRNLLNISFILASVWVYDLKDNEIIKRYLKK